MPSVLHAYRVFIASPGGLERERAEFRAAVNHHNESDAIERGVIFLPVGWELTPGGVGRPQQLINEDVRRCDYFFLVLGDRWGSATAADEQGFSSGTEEEFTVASQCHSARTMRDLVVFFKTVSPEKLRDPGDQLKPVLDFRKRLEAEKKLLFESFDELPTFRDKLQRHLARWVRDHENGRSDPRRAPVAPPPAIHVPSPRFTRLGAPGAPGAPGSEAVRGADQLVREGRVTEAGTVLAQAMHDDDLEAMHKYAALQAQFGNPSAAEASFRRLRENARARGDVDWEVESLMGLAGVYAALDRTDDQEACYLEAVALREAAGGPDDPEVAATLNVLAEFYSSHGRPQEALNLLERAFAIQGVPLVP